MKKKAFRRGAPGGSHVTEGCSTNGVPIAGVGLNPVPEAWGLGPVGGKSGASQRGSDREGGWEREWELEGTPTLLSPLLVSMKKKVTSEFDREPFVCEDQAVPP